MKSQIQNKQFDFVLLILIVVILGAGILMLGSSSFVRGSYLSDDTMHFMRNQFIFAVLGSVIMIGVSFVNYRFYKRISGYFLIFALGINYLTALVGQVRNDAQRWLKVGSFSFQPSEILKIALIFYLAATLSDEKWGEKSKGWAGILTLLLPTVASLLAVVLQKHISATIIISLICIAIMAYGGVRWYVFLTVIGGGSALLGLVVLIKPDLIEHLSARFAVYFATFMGNTSKVPEGVSEEALSQIHNSILAIGSGGVWGLGFGINLVAAGKAGTAISYGLGQGATLVSALWGILVWREFKGALPKANLLNLAMFVLFLAGLGLIIAAGVG